MVTLYGYTILADLALLAIVIAIFVFASSIHGGASKIVAEEEESYLARRKERMEEAKKGLVNEQIKSLDSEHFVEELKAKIAELGNDLKNIDQSILKARTKAKALTVRNMVAIPSLFLLTSIIASGIAIVTSGILPTIMWALSLALIVTSLYFIYRNLRVVESFSSVMDLSTVVQQALETRKMKWQPVADIGKDIKEQVTAVLLTLTPMEARIIEMCFGISRDRMSPKEIAKEFGTTERNVIRMVAIALRKCRHPSRSRRLRDYLDTIPIMGEKTGEQLFLAAIFGEAIFGE